MNEAVLLWVTSLNDREDQELRPLLEAAEKEVHLHALAEDDLSDYLETQTGDRLIGAVIAPSVKAPVAVARLFLRRLPGSEVIFISGAGDGQKRDTNLAFLYGHHRTIEANDPEEGVRTIRRLLQQAHRQRRSRWALARMNEQIAQVRNETVDQKRVAISDQLLVSILAQSPDALFALDLDGYVLAVNRAAVANFNLKEPEGLHFDKTPLPKELPELKGLVTDAIREKKTLRQEMILERPGTKGLEGVTLEASASPVFHQKNRLVGITVLLRDVTQLKTAEQRLREMNEVLEARVAERTRELEKVNGQMENFLYSVAHDLRTPIRAISGFTKLLQEDQKPHLTNETQGFIERIFAASHRMDLLIRDLLSYSRVAKIELPLEAIELDAVIETACSTVAEQLEASGGEIKIETSPGTVWAHQTTLEQVMINLLSNALHYSRVDQPPRVRVFNEWKKGRCRICIEDNGIGIERTYHQKIFNMFERVTINPNPSGTGIGLAIVKGGIERMGGSVGLESEPGKGSLFWVALPGGPRALAEEEAGAS